MGAPHPDFLLDILSSRQFAEWKAYSLLEPWGEDVEWLRHGIRTSVLANCHRDTKKRREPFKPQDFIPQALRDDPEDARQPSSGARSIELLARWTNASLAVDKGDLARVPRWALQPHERAELDRKVDTPVVILTDT